MVRETSEEEPAAGEDPGEVRSLTSGRAKRAAFIPSIEGGSTGFGVAPSEHLSQSLAVWRENIHRLARELASRRSRGTDNDRAELGALEYQQHYLLIMSLMTRNPLS
jgi:hypothetical protein